MEVADIVIKTKIDNSELEDGVKLTTEAQKRIEEAQKRIEEAHRKTAEAQKEINEAKKEQQQYEEDVQYYNEQIEAIEESNIRLKESIANTKELNRNMQKLNTSVQRISRSFVRWGLAIFGISSIFGLIRNSMNIIAQQDEQLAFDINYMKNVLAYALEPVVRIIVNLAKELLLIIGGIIKMTVGYDIFANANKNLKNANGQAKALKKQLAGFDEMNILQDTSGGGGSGGLGNFDGPTVEEAIKKVKNLKDEWMLFGGEMEKYIHLPLDNWTKAFGKWGMALKGVTTIFSGLWSYITGSVEIVVYVCKLIHGIIVGDAEEIKKSIIMILVGLFDEIYGYIKIFIGWVETAFGIGKALGQQFGEWVRKLIDKGIEKFYEFAEKIKTKWANVRDDIKNKITQIKDWLTNNFGIIGTAIGDIIGGSIKYVVNKVLSKIDGAINGFISQINNILAVLNVLPGVNLKPLKLIVLPRLAKGGIINMPGKGIPIGNAIGGERGQEGVIPLTDSQQMELLGQAIGKYININATVPVYVGNRQIAREIRKINAEDDFAYNGG